MSSQDVTELYNTLYHFVVDWYLNDLTLHIVPGPRSFQCAVPVIIVPLALCCSPLTLPTWGLRWIVFPVVLALQVCMPLSE